MKMGLKVKELPIDERPREKAINYGISSLSNRELLALIVKTGYHNVSALNLADIILRQIDGMANLPKIKVQDLTKIKGIKTAKAIDILAHVELAKRIGRAEVKKKDLINNPQALVSWLKLEIGTLEQEHFVVIYLNVKNEIIHYNVAAIGSVDYSQIHPRDVFKKAVEYNCSKIIIGHNHPSNDTKPSQADILTTKKLSDSGEMLGIGIIDHVIVGQSNYYSFKEHNLL